MPILGLALRDRQRLWEYIFNFHFCAFVTVIALAIIPAECAFQHLSFESQAIHQAKVHSPLQRLRDGTLNIIRFDDLEASHLHAVVSRRRCPDGHVGVPGEQGFDCCDWLTNPPLIAATFMTGAHYFVGRLATAAPSICRGCCSAPQNSRAQVARSYPG